MRFGCSVTLPAFLKESLAKNFTSHTPPSAANLAVIGQLAACVFHTLPGCVAAQASRPPAFRRGGTALPLASAKPCPTTCNAQVSRELRLCVAVSCYKKTLSSGPWCGRALTSRSTQAQPAVQGAFGCNVTLPARGAFGCSVTLPERLPVRKK